MNSVILGIESSCDESSVAIVRNGREVLANITARQEEVHRKWGGIVPELASRKHAESLLPVTLHCLEQAGVELRDIDGIAVTNRPGLVGSLIVGVTAAKALAYSTQKPLIPVNHLEAHLASVFLGLEGEVTYPALGLIISGGHTSLYRIEDQFSRFTLIGHTRDDAAGEAFDKAARLLDLPYPGGPEISRLAENGRADAVTFPRALQGKNTLDFSFSGLKTSLVNFLRTKHDIATADIAASFQEAITDALVRKTKQAVERDKYKTVIVAGGVSANSRIRERIVTTLSRLTTVLIPDLKYCTDNGAMIAAMGHILWQKGQVVHGSDVFAVRPLARTELKGKIS